MAGGGRFGVNVCVCTPAQSCPVLCDTMDCSPPGFSVHGILQARILEWIAISSYKASWGELTSLRSPVLAGRFFTTEPPGKSLWNQKTWLNSWFHLSAECP